MYIIVVIFPHENLYLALGLFATIIVAGEGNVTADY